MLIKIKTPPDYCPKVYIYFRSDTHCYRWKYQLPDGTWFHCSAGKDSKVAKRNAHLKEADLIRGLLNSDELKKLSSNLCCTLLTIEAAVQLYLVKTGVAKTAHTRNQEAPVIKACFRVFAEQFKLKMISEVRQDHIDEFRYLQLKAVAENRIRPRTAKNKLSELAKVFRWLKKHNKIVVNPAADVDPIVVQAEDN